MQTKKIILTCIFFISIYTIVYSQKLKDTDSNHSSLEIDSILKQGPEYDLIKPLVGNWKVVQTIYSQDAGKIMSRDTFKVERKMIGNFLQETMQPVITTAANAFTRISYLNYNRTNLRWEYSVFDTRFPVMMAETSSTPKVIGDSITLYLDAFLFPPFFGKEYGGMIAKERRVITFKSSDLYIHRQYMTLPAGKEFLAVEYAFTKQ